MFFDYSQNNSGGRFTKPAQYVIVEANSADEANSRAEEIGLYFDGYGDCECCGSRWSSQWKDEKGTKQPTIYGSSLSNHKKNRNWWDEECPHLLIYRLDGTKELFEKLEDLPD